MRDMMEFRDTEDEYIAQSIRKHGWHAITVEAGEQTPGFLYTIGFMETYHHPEVIVFGLPVRIAHTLVSDMVEDFKHGTTYAHEGIYEGLLEGLPVAIRPVHPTQHLLYFGYALGHIRQSKSLEPLEAVQLLWPDKAHTFPFETSCDGAVCRLQPRLDLVLPLSEREEFIQEYGNA